MVTLSGLTLVVTPPPSSPPVDVTICYQTDDVNVKCHARLGCQPWKLLWFGEMLTASVTILGTGLSLDGMDDDAGVVRP